MGAHRGPDGPAERRTTYIYGLQGHDEDYGLAGDPEEVWRADTIDTIAGLLRGRYHVDRWSWRARPYRTHVTNLAGDARKQVVAFDSLLGWLPLPRRVVTATTYEIDYACRGDLADPTVQT